MRSHLRSLPKPQAMLDRYEVAHSVIGQFTDSERLEAYWRGKKVVDLDMAFLWGGCPIDPVADRQARTATSAAANCGALHSGGMVGGRPARADALSLRDQSAAGSRFDSTVQGRTAVGPYGGKNHRMPSSIYVSAPLRGKSYGMITTLAFNPFYGEIDPGAMARLMMIEAITKAVVAGADYREWCSAITFTHRECGRRSLGT